MSIKGILIKIINYNILRNLSFFSAVDVRILNHVLMILFIIMNNNRKYNIIIIVH